MSQGINYENNIEVRKQYNVLTEKLNGRKNAVGLTSKEDLDFITGVQKEATDLLEKSQGLGMGGK